MPLTQHVADTPVKYLCAIDPSLQDSPSSSFSHITVDLDRWGAPTGPDPIQTAGFEPRTVDLGAVWHTETQVRLSNIRHNQIQFQHGFHRVSSGREAVGTDLRAGCPGPGQIRHRCCCPVGSSAVSCVGGAPVSVAVSSKAAPAAATEPAPRRSRLTPTQTHQHICVVPEMFTSIPFHYLIWFQIWLLGTHFAC